MTPEPTPNAVLPPPDPPPPTGAEAEAWARRAAADTGTDFAATVGTDAETLADWSLPSRLRADLATLGLADGDFSVAVADPFDVGLLDAAALAVGRAVRPVVTTRAALAHRWQNTPEAPAPAGEDAAAVRRVDEILLGASRARASDVHLEPLARRFRVRFRIDGSLVATTDVPSALAPAVVSRLKLLGGLALDERRLPQDGRARVRLAGRDLDLRIASVPTEHGESLAVRLLEPEAPRRGLAELGLEADDEAALRHAIRAGDGLVLVTGPTGSGKTTTLYACLHELNQPGRKILTVEDPVEYRLPGISQVAVNPAGGMTFAAALRAFLRQAPNVVMVGEIRDAETAALALHAALTGHLVLSTLHTNDAVGAVARLLDLGARPALVAAALRATVAQRLVRRVCPECSRPVAVAAHEATALGLNSERAATTMLRRGAGCAACGGTGHRGRVGVFEVLACGEVLRARIASGAGTAELQAAAAAASGWRPLAGSAGRKVLAGATTIDEFLAITAGRPAGPNAFPP